MDKNVQNQEVTNKEKISHDPRDFPLMMSPTGEMVNTIFATTTLGTQAADMYLELQRLLQQGSIKTNNEGYGVKKTQAKKQKAQQEWSGGGMLVGAGISMGMFAGSVIYQTVKNKAPEIKNAQAFEEAATGLGKGAAGVTDVEKAEIEALRGNQKVQDRLEELAAGIDFKTQKPTDAPTRVGSIHMTDKELLEIATPAQREKIRTQAKDKVAELKRELSDTMQLVTQLITPISQIASGVSNFPAAEKQYEATERDAEANYLSTFGNQLAGYASQDGQQVQSWLELSMSILQTMGALDDANNR